MCYLKNVQMSTHFSCKLWYFVLFICHNTLYSYHLLCIDILLLKNLVFYSILPCEFLKFQTLKSCVSLCISYYLYFLYLLHSICFFILPFRQIFYCCGMLYITFSTQSLDIAYIISRYLLHCTAVIVLPVQ